MDGQRDTSHGGSVAAEDVDDQVDAAEDAEVTNEPLLAERFIDDLFADPSILDAVPGGATILIVDPTDAEDAAMKEDIARRRAERGWPTYVHRLREGDG